MEWSGGSHYEKKLTLRQELNEFTRHVAVNFHRARLLDKAVYVIGVGQSKSWLGRCGMLVADHLEAALDFPFPVFGGSKLPVLVRGIDPLIANIRKGDPGAYIVVAMGMPCFSDQEAGTLRAYPGTLARWVSFGTPFADSPIDLLLSCSVDIRRQGAGFLVGHAAFEMARCIQKAARTYRTVKRISQMSLKSVDRYNERMGCDQLAEAAYELRDTLWDGDEADSEM